MDAVEKTVIFYLTEAGASPFESWFDDLRDMQAQQRILARIARMRAGNCGDWKNVGGGVNELRIDHGPGYRLYVGQDGERLIILLMGGDKRSQAKDIKRAKEYWNDYQEREKEKKF